MPPASTANAAGQTLIGSSGTVYVGAYASVTAPTAERSSLDTDLFELGFISEDGVKFRDSKEIGSLRAWQTPYDVRRFVTGREFEIEFALEQWNWNTLPFALGGGALTEPTPGHYKYTAPDADDIDERAIVVDWIDYNGTTARNYRLFCPRGIITAPVEVTLKRDEGAMFPLTYGAIFDGTNPAFTIFTDDAAFEVA